MSLPLIALFLAAFAFGTAEFVIAGILPDVARGLGVTIPVAGYLISFYAIGIAIGGPLLAVATKKLTRKVLILLLGSVFVVGQVLCAIAPTFELLMLARILVSVVHGAYFGIAAIVAVSIVAPEKRGFAVALILSGLTVSNILGVPGGTAIGNAFDWRATFWAVGAIGLVATLAVAFFLPRNVASATTSGSFMREFRVLGRPPIITCLAITVLVMIGQYSLFTYVAPLLTEVTGLDEGLVPWLLLLYGVGSTVGVFIGGRLADWRLMPSLITILALQAVMFTAMYFVSPYPMLMAVTTIIWGGVNFAFGSPVQSRVLAWAADAPNLVSALIPTGFNVGIAIGAILGAALIDAGFGYGVLPLIGAACSALSAAIALLSAIWDRRTGATPPIPAPAE
ncbi:MFS transporter, DHA1 family, inner membrane transport protein [Devosia crocina]|uniref:MFS transporter, DHA1 family, inner membrane transport protein n=1 Tax=Devosia crocina TaxID=429728 RepID=A0A1I7N628_9HYPH|nr:MFS transporter [Devosia crocina]SFV30043.1 MFS transporter, DHA1 family, inner membrane transport protein [Devosia crocina]